ncbi:MAG TPA: hypothetical protein VGN14_06240 [Candidatus Elarobacter sp.]
MPGSAQPRVITRSDRIAAAAAALATIVVLGIYSHFQATVFNNFVQEADAWLQGLPYLPKFPGDYIDAVPYHGHWYVYEAPLPAVLMLPLVGIWHLQANQTLVAILLSAVGVAGAWIVARRIGLSTRWTALLVAFLLFGTSYAYCGAVGDVWFIAHSGAVAFTMLAIAECLGSRRPGRVALWAMCAGFCRYPMFLATPAYFIAVWSQLERPIEVWRVVRVLLLFGIPAVWYDEIRWGTFADVGFANFYRILDVGKTDPTPPEALKYLPMQLHFFFAEPPRFVNGFPYLIAGRFGTALTYTSPALLIALLAPLRERAVQLLWFATLCCAAPAFGYYSNGMIQLGARHALDFIPFLFALMAFAIRTRPHWLYIPLFAWSIAFGIIELGVWEWNYDLVKSTLALPLLRSVRRAAPRSAACCT